MKGRRFLPPPPPQRTPLPFPLSVPPSSLPPPPLLPTCPPLAMKLCTRWGPCSDRLLSNSGPVKEAREGWGGLRGGG